MESRNLTRRWFRWLGGLTALMALMSTGCQVDIAGQTLPSPWYLTDDIQFFRAGPEFPLSREAAEMQRYRAQQELEEELPRP